MKHGNTPDKTPSLDDLYYRLKYVEPPVSVDLAGIGMMIAFSKNKIGWIAKHISQHAV